MRSCIHDGTLQAWFDGELSADEAAEVGAHLSLCVQCAEAARTAESENRILAEALANEFVAAIPTDRLRQRLTSAVAALHHPAVPSISQSRSRTGLKSLTSFRSLAYAAMVAAILFAGFFGFAYLNKESATPTAAHANLAVVLPATSPQPAKQDHKPAPSASRNIEKRRSRVKSRIRTYEPDAMSLSWQESQYQYAIAKLNEAMKIQPPMRPSLQVEYEYNLAVINHAIATRRDAARRNPNDPQATQFMLTAYQSKVDLLNVTANARELER